MRNFFYASLILLFGFFAVTFGMPYSGYAQRNASVHVSSLIARATLFLAPRTATVLDGSTFEVPVFIDTKGKGINTIELHVKFDPNMLSIVRPSGNRSIIGIWIEPPAYSNIDGTVKLVGVIPNGITTESGLITTITFKALVSGETSVVISPLSQVLANDGLGTEVETEFDRGIYTILPRPPEGVRVFSETHPFSKQWYNNNSPALGWEKPAGIVDFSFSFDNKPFTIPDTIADTKDTVKSYQNLPDGLWYFHIKARKQNVWGTTTHFLVRIDTALPAAFTPIAETLAAALIDRLSISFFTTDALSGIDHYEVGVVEKKQAPGTSPVFVQTESPYQLSPRISGDMQIIVRAFDKAGNVRDGSVNVYISLSVWRFLQDHLLIFLLLFILLLVIFIFRHYLFRHKIVMHLKRIWKFIKKEERSEKK